MLHRVIQHTPGDDTVSTLTQSSWDTLDRLQRVIQLTLNLVSTNLELAPLVAKNANFDPQQLQRLLKHENWIVLHAYNKSIQKSRVHYMWVPDCIHNKGLEYHALDSLILTYSMLSFATPSYLLPPLSTVSFVDGHLCQLSALSTVSYANCHCLTEQVRLPPMWEVIHSRLLMRVFSSVYSTVH